MSVSTIGIIIGRISIATKESPIAVFSLPEKNGKLNAVFGATTTTQAKAKIDASFIGMFHRDMDKGKTLRMLREAA